MGDIDDYRAMRIRCFKERMSKRKTKNGCILWKGALTKSGYGGHVRWRPGERLLAHRFSYLAFNGEFDRKLFICHKCDNPQCVNPEHLYAGTAKDNRRDMMLRDRIKKIELRAISGIINIQTIGLPRWAV